LVHTLNVFSGLGLQDDFLKLAADDEFGKKITKDFRKLFIYRKMAKLKLDIYTFMRQLARMPEAVRW